MGAAAAEAEARLRERLGRGWRTAAIGRPGKRGVRYATISHDGRHAGRGGLGAVLGAKRLKAVAVRAATKVAPADPEAVLAAARDLRARSFGPATAKYRELGTLANLLAFNAISALPTRNFQAATFAGAPRLAAEELAEMRTVARNSCASCTIGCEHIYSARGGKKMRVEYENVFALGPMCGVSDPDAVLAASGAVRRAGAGHHLGGRDDRLGDGVRRAGPDRRALAAVRRRGRADAGADGDRRARRARRPARRGLAAGGGAGRRRLGGRSRRTSRAWRCPVTSRARCTPWRSAWR